MRILATITVVVGEPPYGKERAYTSLRFILTALIEKHIVNLFLLEDGVFLAKKGQRPPEMPTGEKMPNCEELLKMAIKEGAQVKICGVCATERGLIQSDLIEGAALATMHDLVDWVVKSDKSVFF